MPDDAERYTRLGVGLAEIIGTVVGGAYGVDTTGINKGINASVDAGFAVGDRPKVVTDEGGHAVRSAPTTSTEVHNMSVPQQAGPTATTKGSDPLMDAARKTMGA